MMPLETHHHVILTTHIQWNIFFFQDIYIYILFFWEFQVYFGLWALIGRQRNKQIGILQEVSSFSIGDHMLIDWLYQWSLTSSFGILSVCAVLKQRVLLRYAWNSNIEPQRMKLKHWTPKLFHRSTEYATTLSWNISF